MGEMMIKMQFLKLGNKNTWVTVLADLKKLNPKLAVGKHDKHHNSQQRTSKGSAIGGTSPLEVGVKMRLKKRILLEIFIKE